MGKTLVVYESKYGTTKQYAKWLAGELGADLRERREATEGELGNYDTLIFGGGLYAGGVLGLSFFKKNYDNIRGRRIALFTCGLGDPAVADNIKNIREGLEKSLGTEILGEIKLFHLRGAMDYSRLNLLHRSMMSMVRKAVEHRKEEDRTEEEWQMLDTFGKTVDFMDKSTLLPLIQWARGEGQGA